MALGGRLGWGSVGGRGGGVLLVGDGGQPVDDVVVGVALVDGQVNHEPVGRGTVPVLLVGLAQHAVAEPDGLDRPAPALAGANLFGDEDCQWVAVPVGARAPGMKCTRAAVTREGAGAGATGSM
jgi:hypothetical protein